MQRNDVIGLLYPSAFITAAEIAVVPSVPPYSIGLRPLL